MEKGSSITDFEQFWLHFLSSHRKPATRWAHTVGLSLGVLGGAAALVQRRVTPLLLGAGAFAALALGAHPLFEANTPENFGRPLWAARALGRMWLRTLNGSIEADIERLDREQAAGESPAAQ